MKTPHVVIDTNIFIAAQRSRQGASSRLVSLIGTDLFEIHVSVPLVLEYEQVLMRQRRTLGVSQQDVTDLIDAVCALAVPHDVHFLWRPFLRDPGDHLVLEVAVAGSCDYIVTYNKRDFRGVETFGLETVDAREFLDITGALTS